VSTQHRLLERFAKSVLETALNEEMTEHLGTSWAHRPAPSGEPWSSGSSCVVGGPGSMRFRIEEW